MIDNIEETFYAVSRRWGLQKEKKLRFISIIESMIAKPYVESVDILALDDIFIGLIKGMAENSGLTIRQTVQLIDSAKISASIFTPALMRNLAGVNNSNFEIKGFLS